MLVVFVCMAPFCLADDSETVAVTLDIQQFLSVSIEDADVDGTPGIVELGTVTSSEVEGLINNTTNVNKSSQATVGVHANVPVILKVPDEVELEHLVTPSTTQLLTTSVQLNPTNSSDGEILADAGGFHQIRFRPISDGNTPPGDLPDSSRVIVTFFIGILPVTLADLTAGEYEGTLTVVLVEDLI